MCLYHQICANIMEYCQALLLQSSAEAQFTVCLFSPSASEPTGQLVWLDIVFFPPLSQSLSASVHANHTDDAFSLVLCILSFFMAQTWRCHQCLESLVWVWFCSCWRTVQQTSFDTMTATDRVWASCRGLSSSLQRSLKRYKHTHNTKWSHVQFYTHPHVAKWLVFKYNVLLICW